MKPWIHICKIWYISFEYFQVYFSLRQRKKLYLLNLITIDINMNLIIGCVYNKISVNSISKSFYSFKFPSDIRTIFY